MRQTVKRILERYGQSVSIHYGGGAADAATRAFLQPLEEKQGDLPTPLGAVKRTRYLYLGDPEVRPEGPGEGYILWQGRRFRVVTAQAVFLGDRVNHWRAVLTEQDEE
ncbi:MAG: hypothetical protein RR216_05380 [Pseudoflavonifractor sp.]